MIFGLFIISIFTDRLPQQDALATLSCCVFWKIVSVKLLSETHVSLVDAKVLIPAIRRGRLDKKGFPESEPGFWTRSFLAYYSIGKVELAVAASGRIKLTKSLSDG